MPRKPTPTTTAEVQRTVQFKTDLETLREIEAARGRLIEDGRLEVSGSREAAILWLLKFALAELKRE